MSGAVLHAMIFVIALGTGSEVAVSHGVHRSAAHVKNCGHAAARHPAGSLHLEKFANGMTDLTNLHFRGLKKAAGDR